jgi:predicted anti-sigma-YlaC factor YlaD
MLGPKDISARCLAFLGLSLALVACSPKRIGEEAFADSLASSGDTYSSDDDLQLVGAATPFGLKTMEGLLADLPNHQGLLTAAAAGFTGYAYAYVHVEAEQNPNLEQARAGRVRARKLFIRARDYGLRSLDVAHPGLAAALVRGNTDARKAALAATVKEDVPALYWTGAAWALAISDGKDQMMLVGQLPAVTDAMERALALDESWEQGTLHDFFVSFDAARGEAPGGGPDRARQHLERGEELSHGTHLSPKVAYAEGVLIPSQDRKGFRRMLDEVLAYDVDQPEARKVRLANVLAQRRARWLLGRQDDLFL